jgi:hypothetical protein
MSQISLASAKVKTLVADLVITGAVASGALTKLTCVAHGLETGDILQVTGVTGTVEANGQWTVTRVTADTFTLDGSTFLNAYVSGGAAKHIGFATAAGTVDNSVFTTKPDFTLKARLEYLDSGANARIIFEDAADTAFATRQPVAVFQAPGKVGGTTAGAFSGKAGELEKQYMTKSYDVPDVRMAASGDVLRAKIFISGGAGKSAQFSAWMEY